MSMEMVRSFLLWCTVINYAVLVVWFLVYRLAHGWLAAMGPMVPFDGRAV